MTMKVVTPEGVPTNKKINIRSKLKFKG